VRLSTLRAPPLCSFQAAQPGPITGPSIAFTRRSASFS